MMKQILLFGDIMACYREMGILCIYVHTRMLEGALNPFKFEKHTNFHQ